LGTSPEIEAKFYRSRAGARMGPDQRGPCA